MCFTEFDKTCEGRLHPSACQGLSFLRAYIHRFLLCVVETKLLYRKLRWGAYIIQNVCIKHRIPESNNWPIRTVPTKYALSKASSVISLLSCPVVMSDNVQRTELQVQQVGVKRKRKQYSYSSCDYVWARLHSCR